MKSVISYSIWGENPVYWIGAIRNIELAKEYYPGWISRFYIDKNCRKDLIESLRGNSVEIKIVDTDFIGNTYDGSYAHSHQGMFWRFLAFEDSDLFISRDCDCRISKRESDAVNEWIESGKQFHIMRDHPYHSAPILGGMWGSKSDFLRSIDFSKKIEEWVKVKRSYNLGVDQDFLGTIIYPLIYKDALEHSGFNIKFNNELKPFSNKRNNYEFVGDSFDENDNRHPEYWKIIKKILG
jgi:hypothetical protein